MISTYRDNGLTCNLTENELDLFKELLVAMDGMDVVTIYNLHVSWSRYLFM